ncbi:hypothetical protein M427DRAFT_105875 [Gonapodya prolifera JEL478]|uniref:Protein SDA1 n=1 Tax=Gonapodya prolifera (strain JEL478) TaxID=1344416 RepID=A0A138ZXG7_GONPJ|nr:hypothetical protein M427DRAFT_105875 [Gonapodya prolifera JEL478]|eukprot:KXS09179.1 hypothetical protein M427DRAFT_105875 [Gonapodya prolifera JEL478]
MGKGTRTRARVDALNLNLPQLQNLIKRDPSSYTAEFQLQLKHFQSRLDIFLLKPADSDEHEELGDLITFIAHVAPCYPKLCAQFPQQVSDLLSNHHQNLNPDLRKTMVQALMLLRNRDLISQTSLLSLFFVLFRCRDKQLRQLLHSHIVSDIKNANQKAKNNKLNKTLQNFMYTMLGDAHEIAAKKSLDVMIDLYKKNVWNDAKTVNVIGEACFHSSPKVCATAINFFLGANREEEEEADVDMPDITVLKHQAHIKKKTKSEKAKLEKAMATIKKKERAALNSNTALSFPPLHLLNDPQSHAEKLFSRLRQATSQSTLPFPLRLAHLDLITRLVGAHKLVLLNIYPFIAKYLNPHQKDVTRLLACAAQATHDLVPPDAVEEVVRAVADRFVWGNYSGEVVVAGLNAIRELSARQPLAMPAELLDSLVADHKGHREKGVTNATRALVGLFREVNPELLHKKHRGKVGTIEVAKGIAKVKEYGQMDVAEGVAGAELLQEMDVDEDEDAESSGSAEDGGDGSDGDGSWSDVEEEEGDVDAEADGSDEENDNDEEEEEEGEEASKEAPSGETETEGTSKAEVKPSTDVRIEAQKILTDDDFRIMKKLRTEKEAQRLTGQGLRIKDVKGKKRTHAEMDDGSDDEEHDSDAHYEPDEFVHPDAMLAGYKRKQTKEERSTTNKVKSKKTKNIMMMVHKREVWNKKMMSSREKTKRRREHVKRQKRGAH